MSTLNRHDGIGSLEHTPGSSTGRPPRVGRRWYARCKAVVEWPIALVLFVLALPLIVLFALLAKALSPGPAFYRQVRLGRHGAPFAMYKIRTMAHNCEAATGAVWAASNDPRVIPIGRFLRDTHLDELPQLWHVLQGRMSLIGPRPERPEIAARIERTLPHFRLRLQVRPGLTGLAQVHLPADREIDGVAAKLEYDLYYAHHLSPWLDLRILLCTALCLVSLCIHGAAKLLVKSYETAVERDARRTRDPQNLRMVAKADGQVGAV